MERFCLLILFAAVVSACGCAGRKPLLRPGDNPDEITATIARNGRSPDPASIKEGTGSETWPNTVKTAAKTSCFLGYLGLDVLADMLDGLCNSTWPPRKGSP